MPIISAKIIKKTRQSRYCDGTCCKKIPKGSVTIKLYGNAFNGDPKYNLFLCMDCAIVCLNGVTKEVCSYEKIQKLLTELTVLKKKGKPNEPKWTL